MLKIIFDASDFDKAFITKRKWKRKYMIAL